MTALPEARILAEVPLAKGNGRRVVAIDEGGVCHVFAGEDDRPDHSPEQRFTPEVAREMARRVLAGDERAQTTHGVMRILAAAVLADGGM